MKWLGETLNLANMGDNCFPPFLFLQPFREQYPVNPSYEIAKGLPDYLPPLRAKDPGSRAAPVDVPGVRIRVHPAPIRVSYAVVRELVPSLWRGGRREGEEDGNDDGGGYFDEGGEEAAAAAAAGQARLHQTTPDIVLHIGMAGPRPFYQIERRGHRQGYRAPDVDGRMLEDEKIGGHGDDWIWRDCPDELKTDLNMTDILERWKRYSPVGLPSLPSLLVLVYHLQVLLTQTSRATPTSASPTTQGATSATSSTTPASRTGGGRASRGG